MLRREDGRVDRPPRLLPRGPRCPYARCAVRTREETSARVRPARERAYRPEAPRSELPGRDADEWAGSTETAWQQWQRSTFAWVRSTVHVGGEFRSTMQGFPNTCERARTPAQSRQAGGHWFEPSTAHRKFLQFPNSRCLLGRRRGCQGKDPRAIDAFNIGSEHYPKGGGAIETTRSRGRNRTSSRSPLGDWTSSDPGASSYFEQHRLLTSASIWRKRGGTPKRVQWLHWLCTQNSAESPHKTPTRCGARGEEL